MKEIAADMFLYFFVSMDISLIEMMLNDDELYMGKNKTEFVVILNHYFETQKQQGNTSLLPLMGAYTNKKSGYSFVGNKTLEQLNIAVETDTENNVVSITDCQNFELDLQQIKNIVLPDGLINKALNNKL